MILSGLLILIRLSVSSRDYTREGQASGDRVRIKGSAVDRRFEVLVDLDIG